MDSNRDPTLHRVEERPPDTYNNRPLLRTMLDTVGITFRRRLRQPLPLEIPTLQQQASGNTFHHNNNSILVERSNRNADQNNLNIQAILRPRMAMRNRCLERRQALDMLRRLEDIHSNWGLRLEEALINHPLHRTVCIRNMLRRNLKTWGTPPNSRCRTLVRQAGLTPMELPG